MDTAFIIGNGESRNIFPIQELKDKGVIYGCNAIYRDYPDLCDHIVAVNDPMYNELKEWHDKTKPNLKIHGPDDLLRKHVIRELAIDCNVPKISAYKQKKALQYGTKIHKSLLKSRKTS